MRRLLFSKGAKKRSSEPFLAKAQQCHYNFPKMRLITKNDIEACLIQKLKSRKQRYKKSVNWQYDAEMFSDKPKKSYWSVIWEMTNSIIFS